MNKKQFEKNKKKIQAWVSQEYPGVTISWNGINPTIHIPDALAQQAREIASYVKEAIRLHGGSAEFQAG